MANRIDIFEDLINPDNSRIIEGFRQIEQSMKELAATIKTEADDISKSLSGIKTNTAQGQKATESLAGEVAELAEKYKQYTQRIKELEELNKKLIAQNEQLKKARKEEIDQKKAAESLDRQRVKAYAAQEKQRAKEQAAADKAAKQLAEETALLSREAKSIAELAKQTSLLAKKRREMDASLDPKGFEDISKQIANNNARLKEFDAQIGNYQRNVGNYMSAWEGAPGVFGQVGQGVSGVSDMLKGLIKVPVIAVFAALAAIISTLVGAFMKSESGAKLLRKANAYLSTGMETLIKIAEKAVDILISVWEDPMQALKDFGNAILSQITTRVEGMIQGFKNFGNVIKALWSGDMKQIKAALLETADAASKVVSGRSLEDWKKTGDAIAKTASEADALAASFEKLYNAQYQNEKLNQRLGLQIEKLRGEEELYAAQLDNSRISFAERQKYVEKYAKVALERAEFERKLAAENVAIIRQELSLVQNDFEKRRELQQRLNDAQKEQIQVENELLQTRRDVAEKILTLESDNFEQRLDYEQDYTDAVLESNKTIIENERTTVAERARLLGETTTLAEKSWAKQKELINGQAKSYLDIEKLLTMQNAQEVRNAAEAAGLDEIAQTRLLQTLERRKKFLSDDAALKTGALKLESDLSQKAFDQQQALDKAVFEGSKHTEQEKSKFAIKQQIEKYKKQLEIAAKYEQALSDVERETILKNIANLEKELQGTGKDKRNILDLLGFDFGENSEQAKSQIAGAFASVKDFFTSRAEAAEAAAARVVNARQKETDAAQSAYEKELELQSQGLANDADLAKKRLDEAEANEQKALAAQEKAAKKRAQIESIAQGANILSSVSNIWKAATGTGIFGYILAGVQTAALFGSWAASKIKAKEATKVEYSEGGFVKIGGGTHASGKDTTFAVVNGVEHRAERGESHAIFTPRASRKYNSVLPAIVNAANDLMLEQVMRLDATPTELQSSRDYTRILERQARNAERSTKHLENIAGRVEPIPTTENGRNVQLFIKNGQVIKKIYKD